jgi:hypothetical protein
MMARPKKDVENIETINETVSVAATKKSVTPNDIEWTDHVLSLLSDDEKINGNPTTDGLRRVFEIALNCAVVESTSNVVQTPDINNEKRATVVHTIGYILNNSDSNSDPMLLNMRTVSGAADVYWGNCDKVFRNHPVAVAETRAEGRALRRGLKLRKVVAAEEIAKEIEDNPDGDTVSKISSNQINFIDVLSKRMDINVTKMLANFGHTDKNVYNIEHSDAINFIRTLTSYQQDISNIPEDIKGYDSNWK